MMDSEAAPSRGYESPLRAEQARLTQRRILDAALVLLLGRGYGATTMAAVAKEAGGGLRPGLSIERAADMIWALDSVEVWHLLVRERGWTADEYGAWLGTAMADAVLRSVPDL